MFAGVIGTGLLFAPLLSFYESTSRGAITLPQLFGTSYGVIVFAVVAVALVGFRTAEWVESRA